MSRHRRQASQALPVVFDVAEEEPPKARCEGLASGAGGSTVRADDAAAGATAGAQTKAPLPSGSTAGAKPKKKPSDGGT